MYWTTTQLNWFASSGASSRQSWPSWLKCLTTMDMKKFVSAVNDDLTSLRHRCCSVRKYVYIAKSANGGWHRYKFNILDIIDRLEMKFSIGGCVHLQLFNAIAIRNCSSAMQQPTQAVTSLRSTSRWLAGRHSTGLRLAMNSRHIQTCLRPVAGCHGSS
jgi:hypothetical protein